MNLVADAVGTDVWAPAWTIVAAAVPAALALIGTIWQANATRRVPASPKPQPSLASAVRRINRSEPRWPILPRFARQMIAWHVLVGVALVVLWAYVGPAAWWLPVFSALYGAGALYYGILLRLSHNNGPGITTLEISLTVPITTFSARCLQSLNGAGIEVLRFNIDTTSAELTASTGGATMTAGITTRNEPASSDGTRDPDSRATETMIDVVAVCTPTRGIDGALRARRLADWFTSEIIDENLPVPGSSGDGINHR